MINSSCVKKAGLFLGGVLFGTAGIKLLSSKDAKKAYVHCTAAVLRAKDYLMKTSNTRSSVNMEDILAEAEAINEARSEAEEAAEVAEDETGEVTE